MKITMYELLGMIKDGNVPKRIIYDQFVYVWNSKIENYQREVDEITTLNWDYIAINCLNEPVDILNKSIEEEKKDNFTGWKMYQDGKEVCLSELTVKEAEENLYKFSEALHKEANKKRKKKIPEKLYKYMEIEEEGCYENILRVYDDAEYEINEDMSFVIDKINSIIDYLKSKGE